MPRGYRGPRRRKGSREFRPPRAPEKKWEPRLTAHSLAFGSIIERIPAYERARIMNELSSLMRTAGADDYVHRKKTTAAGVFARKVLHLFPKNIKLGEDYLLLLHQYFS